MKTKLLITINNSETVSRIKDMVNPDKHIPLHTRPIVSRNTLDIDKQFLVNITDLFLAFENYDIIYIATPDYNNSIPGEIKTLIDWFSFDQMDGKVFGLIGYGKYGGQLATEHLRQVLSTFNTRIASKTVNILTDIDVNHLEQFKLMTKQLDELHSDK